MVHQTLTTRVPTINLDYAERLLQSLRDLAWTEREPQRGMNCYGYSVDEKRAIDLVVNEAARLGMEAIQDHAGNVYLIKRGTDATKKARMMVSHLDTVPGGGAYDGRDGIVAGLAMVQAISDRRIDLKHDICIMIARSEESAVNNCFSLGAKLATEQITATEISKLSDNTGELVCTKLVSSGLNINQIFRNAPLIPVGSVATSLVQSVLELHIEQGKYCATADADICIVKAIRGNTRFLSCSIGAGTSTETECVAGGTLAHVVSYPAILITGEAAHSGATFEEDRADAVREAVALLQMAQDWCTTQNKTGQNVRLVPISLNTTNRSLSTIPDNSALGFRIEANEPERLSQFDQHMRSWVKTRSEANPKFRFSKIETTPIEAATSAGGTAPALSRPIEIYLSLISAAERWFQEQRAADKDVVFTPSIVHSQENGRGITFSFEIRSTDQEVLDGFSEFITIYNDTTLSGAISLPTPIITKAVKMNDELVTDLMWASKDMSAGVTASGAGHDASTLAQAGYPTVMIFIRQPNPISHNPEEQHDRNSFAKACQLGLELMLKETEPVNPVTLDKPEPIERFSDYVHLRGGVSYQSAT